MAVYVSPGRRRQRLIGAVVAALVVGAVVGAVVGRSTAPSIDDKVAGARSSAETAAAGLSVLPLEYRQAFAGEGGGATQDTVEQAGSRVTTALADSPWLTQAQRTRVSTAVGALTDAASRKAPPAQFDAAVRRVQAVVADLFGVEIAGGIAAGGSP